MIQRDGQAEVQHTRFRAVGRRTLSRRRRGLVRLWSHQSLAVWHALQSQGTLYVDESFIDAGFRANYKWMRKQMRRRLPDFQGHFPWWAYEGHKPDMRGWMYGFPGGQAVCLELQLPPERVLLSDYETWHSVMSRWYLNLTELEDEECEREYERENWDRRYHAWPPPKAWRRRVVRSWERIFDIEALRAGGYSPAATTQACFERLDLNDVVAVTELQAR